MTGAWRFWLILATFFLPSIVLKTKKNMPFLGQNGKETLNSVKILKQPS